VWWDVALSAAPLIDPATGDVIGEICGMRDITEHRRAQQTERELEQNRRLTQLIQTRLEEERRAIARELHDELGQCVTAIKTIGAAIANRTKESSSEIHASAQTIVSVARAYLRRRARNHPSAAAERARPPGFCARRSRTW
jgi:glucose-6-phosphate-specific signal transduction histidine kinase